MAEQPYGHGLDLARDRWDQAAGALELWCTCGYVVRDLPPAHNRYDSQLEALDADQIRAFRRHLEEARR